MQTFDNVLAALNEIASVPGKLDKQALVAKHMSNPDFEKVVVLMLNPFKRFYIKNFKDLDYASTTYHAEDAYEIFDSLSDRSISGDRARAACGDLVANGFPDDLMIRILNKDPKAGFGESTVNKVKKGLIPDFVYQRCALPKDAKFSTWDWKKGVISQEKADGMYCAINKSGGEITMSARSGSQFPIESFTDLVGEALDLLANNTQTQGELLVCDRAGNILPREIGNGMLNKVSQGGDWVDGAYPIYRAWDQIPMDQVIPKVKYHVGYADRFRNLNDQLTTRYIQTCLVAVIDTRIVHSMEEAKAHYAEMLEAGKEGIILSEPNAPWIDSTSKFKIKFKLTAPCELRVTGYRKGNGKNAELFGSLICESEDGLLEVAVSGFKDNHRKEIFENMENVIGSIMTVDSNMIMSPSKGDKKWSLFLPRFAEFRKDRTTADTLEKIKAQFEAAINSI